MGPAHGAPAAGNVESAIVLLSCAPAGRAGPPWSPVRRLQLLLYSDLLAQVQGIEPERLHLALGAGDGDSQLLYNQKNP